MESRGSATKHSLDTASPSLTATSKRSASSPSPPSAAITGQNLPSSSQYSSSPSLPSSHSGMQTLGDRTSTSSHSNSAHLRLQVDAGDPFRFLTVADGRQTVAQLAKQIEEDFADLYERHFRAKLQVQRLQDSRNNDMPPRLRCGDLLVDMDKVYVVIKSLQLPPPEVAIGMSLGMGMTNNSGISMGMEGGGSGGGGVGIGGGGGGRTYEGGGSGGRGVGESVGSIDMTRVDMARMAEWGAMGGYSGIGALAGRGGSQVFLYPHPQLLPQFHHAHPQLHQLQHAGAQRDKGGGGEESFHLEQPTSPFHNMRERDREAEREKERDRERDRDRDREYSSPPKFMLPSLPHGPTAGYPSVHDSPQAKRYHSEPTIPNLLPSFPGTSPRYMAGKG